MSFWIQAVVGIIIAIGMAPEDTRAFTIPKRNYGFLYRRDTKVMGDQSMTQIDVVDASSKDLIDQFFLVRYQDASTRTPLKVRSYAEAEAACSKLTLPSEAIHIPYLPNRFEIPFDYEIFFLIDEDLVTLDRRIEARGHNETLEEKIYPFWTQGPWDPGSISTFKLD